MKPMNSRSIRLQSRPRQNRGLPGKVVRRRLLGVLTAAVLMLTGAVILRFRLLDPQGWGYPLYRFHDDVLLPIIGYGWRLYQPWSLIWWGIGGVFALVGLAQFLSAPTLLHLPRLRLTHYLLSRPRYHGLLVKTAGLLSRAGFPQTLLLDHIDMLWSIRADQAAAGPPAQNFSRPLADLACLYNRLKPLQDEQRRVVALQLLSTTWVLQRTFGEDDTTVRAALKEKVIHLLPRRREGYALTTHRRHTPMTLASEIAARLALGDADFRHQLHGEDEQHQPAKEGPAAWLDAQYRKRCDHLAQLQRELSRVVREPDQPGYRIEGHDPVSQRVSMALLPAMGRIDCDCVALHALDSGEARYLQQWLEQLSMLRFSLQALPEAIIDETEAARLHAFYEAIPRDGDRLTAAQLARQQADRAAGEHPFDVGFEPIWQAAQTTREQQRDQLSLPTPGSGA